MDFKVLLFGLFLSQIYEIESVYDLTASPNEVVCKFGSSIQLSNSYCQKDEGFMILTDPQERRNNPTWTPFQLLSNRRVGRQTGPLYGMLNGNLQDWYYLLYNSADMSISQASYTSSKLKVSGNSVCLSFNYTMYGAEIGNVFMTADFTTFDQFQRIDSRNPKGSETNGRVEMLLASGDQGPDWKFIQSTIPLKGRTEIQVGIQIVRSSGRSGLGDVALDNVRITNKDGACPTHGNWGAWTEVTQCTKTCGGGAQTKTRTCDSPAPGKNGQACMLSTGSGRAMEETVTKAPCNTQACDVDGNWSPWRITAPCSATCGGGVLTKARTCGNPPASGNGAFCLLSDGSGKTGKEEQITEACNTNACVVNGNWGQWESYTACSKTCGTGVRFRTRKCSSPPPSTGGAFCLLSDGSGGRALQEGQSMSCNAFECPANGNWGQWAVTSQCTTTCGVGQQERTRTCDSPSPRAGGKACLKTGTTNVYEMTEKDQVTCTNGQQCPVDGNWGPWNFESQCSKSCGGGFQKRYRLCNNPAASNGGKSCLMTGTVNTYGSLERDNITCNTNSCPVPTNGNWGQWAVTTQCTTTCGGGTQERRRTCSSPPPSNGGRACLATGTSNLYLNSEQERVTCNNQACKKQSVDGNWGPWVPGSLCSKSCGGGFQTRNRLCNNPPASNGGKSCLMTGTVNTYGVLERENITCNIQPCINQPVNGNWGQWSYVTQCTKTCDGGLQQRVRYCNNPTAANGGKRCLATGTTNVYLNEERDNVVCNQNPCATLVNGNWGMWTNFGQCSSTCAGGVQERIRSCNNPPASNGGRSCLKTGTINVYVTEEKDAVECNKNVLCPVNGNWGQWSHITQCTKTCDGGLLQRVRYCNNPTAANGGKRCLATGTTNVYLNEERDNVVCNQNPCTNLVNGNWGSWSASSACSVTCGSGTLERTRLCNNPPASGGGKSCLLTGTTNVYLDTERDRVTCNVVTCPVHGNWGEWYLTSQCSVTCGTGTEERTRQCNNPPPANNGRGCLKDGSKDEYLMTEKVARECERKSCSKDGNWGQWSAITVCSVTCGRGTQQRVRLCNNPTPLNGGKSCLVTGTSNTFNSVEREIMECNKNVCPVKVDGNWGPWSFTTTCSTTCGSGMQQRIRRCENPRAENGGNSCLVTGTTNVYRNDETDSVPCNDRACPFRVNGNWGAWAVNSSCTVTCNGGTQERMRRCNNPPASNGGIACPVTGSTSVYMHEERDRVKCNEQVCPTDGNWGTWSFGKCSKSCGGGFDVAVRHCSNPFPTQGRRACLKPGTTNVYETRETKTLSCNNQPCVGPTPPKYGNWGNWSINSQCTVTCGGGTQERIRECRSPQGVVNLGCQVKIGSNTEGRMEQRDRVSCSTNACPPKIVNGNWGEWNFTSKCSVHCDGGERERMRMCNNPPAENGGRDCLMSGQTAVYGKMEIKNETCNTLPCSGPVDGNWGDWRRISDCPVSCGSTGTRQWMRTCTEPMPKNGGQQCLIETTGIRTFFESKLIPCNVKPCPGDGNWGDWRIVTACTRPCDGGLRTKVRSCNNPAPSAGGAGCMVSNETKEMRTGDQSLTERCNTDPCPVHGNWGAFEDTLACSVTCGIGTQEKRRRCDNPPASHGGRDCLATGTSDVYKKSERVGFNCTAISCPVTNDGRWGQWAIVSDCSVSCGSGTQTRRRICAESTNSSKRCNGDNGSMIEELTLACGRSPCPVNGNWGQWSLSMQCTRSCGIGTIERIRRCENPPASNGGFLCTIGGNSMSGRFEVERTGQLCNTDTCQSQVDNWVTWGSWSGCNKSCDGGEKRRERRCPSGAKCMSVTTVQLEEFESQTQKCNIQLCAVNGNWGMWADFGTCSRTCGGGVQTRVRRCDNPIALNGGELCALGNTTTQTHYESRGCNVQECIINGNWAQWGTFGTCSKSCGGGVRMRYRYCERPKASASGRQCLSSDGSGNRNYTDIQMMNCNTDACPLTCDANSNPCSAQASCVVGTNGPVCQCTKGFKGDGKQCEDVNECEKDVCPNNACLNLFGTYMCICRSGFTKINNTYCDDVNECLAGNGGCHANAKCINTVGSRLCTCKQGFMGNGLNCVDINECLDSTTNDCHADATCVNTPGSYRCQCKKDFEGDGKFCKLAGQWRPWSEWSGCSHSCNFGVRTRGRQCIRADMVGCLGDVQQTKQCFDKLCPPTISWGAWGQWSTCSGSCGSGTKTRLRSCDGQSCGHGNKTQAVTCNDGCRLLYCPDDPMSKVLNSKSFVSTDNMQCMLNFKNTHEKTVTLYGKTPTGERRFVANLGYKEALQVSSTTGQAYYVLDTESQKVMYFRSGLFAAPVFQGARFGVNKVGDRRDVNIVSEMGSANSYYEHACSFELDCDLVVDNTRGWVIAKQTPSPSTGPKVDHTFPTGCGHFIYLEASRLTANQESYLAMPLPASPVATACATAHVNMYAAHSEHMGSLAIFLWQGQTLRQLWYHSGVLTNSTYWKKISIELTLAPGTPYAFLFKAIRGSGYNSDMALDDLNVVQGPCTETVEGNWAEWNSWGSCSVTCGEGVQTKTRTCSSPPPKHGGKTCPGPSTKTRACKQGMCPVNGNWADWGNWGSCSRTCGGGVSVRFRECSNPHPFAGGSQCTRVDGTIGLEEKEEKRCADDLCPTNGNWSPWSSFTDCSRTCGEGIKSRTRTCNNPRAVGTGLKCIISTSNGNTLRGDTQTETQSCKASECPVNGNWALWQSWGSCSMSCGMGVETRRRVCSNPPAQYGGQACPGDAALTRPCNLQLCVVTGMWANWANWSACSKLCDSGMKRRTRTCLSVPVIAGTISKCPTVSGVMAQMEVESGVCNTQVCDRDGNWGKWTQYSACSADCGDGKQVRSRLCNDPPAVGNGRLCLRVSGGVGSAESQEKACFLKSCVVNGNWGQWSMVNTCNATCGGGQRSRRRVCDNPPSRSGGLDCLMSTNDGRRGKEETIMQACNSQSCPVNGNWGSWFPQTACSKSCGSGIWSVRRNCDNPPASGGGLNCLMSTNDGTRGKLEATTRACNTNLCPRRDVVDCSFTNGVTLGCDWVILPNVTVVFPVQEITRWLIGGGSTPNANTGPTTDADGSGFYLYLNSQTTPQRYMARLVSPVLQAGVKCLRYQYHMWGQSQGLLAVLVYDKDGNVQGGERGRVWGDQGNLWRHMKLTIDSAKEFRIHISFWDINTGSTQDIAIDSISLVDGACA